MCNNLHVKIRAQVWRAIQTGLSKHRCTVFTILYWHFSFHNENYTSELFAQQKVFSEDRLPEHMYGSDMKWKERMQLRNCMHALLPSAVRQGSTCNFRVEQNFSLRQAINFYWRLKTMHERRCTARSDYHTSKWYVCICIYYYTLRQLKLCTLAQTKTVCSRTGERLLIVWYSLHKCRCIAGMKSGSFTSGSTGHKQIYYFKRRVRIYRRLCNLVRNLTWLMSNKCIHLNKGYSQ